MVESAELGVNIEDLQAKSVIKRIPLSDLKVDRAYQRDPSQSLVDKIAAEWDEVASELLLVSDRGDTRKDMWPEKGRFYLVNGQHRSLAAAKQGIKSMSARIIDLTVHPDPASVEAVFRLRTNVRMGDKPSERFKAQLRAGDPDTLAIVKLLESFGTEINETASTEEGVNAVTTVEKLYRVDKGSILKETLELIKDAYGKVGGKGTSAPIMTGLSWFILKHGPEVDRSRFARLIGDLGPAALDRRARAMASTLPGTLWMNYYRTFVDVYNERLSDKSKLEWRLRGASAFKGSAGGYGRNSSAGGQGS